MSEQNIEQAVDEQSVASENVEEVPQEETEAVDREGDAQDQVTDSGWTLEKSLSEIRKKNSENKNLRERAKKAESQLEQVEDFKAKYEQEVAKNLRMSVAHKFGLPAEVADRLRGDSEDELVADAEKLMSLFVPTGVRSQRPVPVEGQSKGDAAPRELTLDDATELIRKLS